MVLRVLLRTAEVSLPGVELHQDLRSAVRGLCKGFPDSYWRAVDQQRAGSGAVVGALSNAGFLAALLPQEEARSRPPAPQASPILAGGERPSAKTVPPPTPHGS